MRKNKKIKGNYIICEDGNEVYSTDSLFWYNFFGKPKIVNDYRPNWVRQITKKKIKRVKSFKEILMDVNT